jgi:hypothetical protein
MRDILSPLDGIRSPFGARRAFIPAAPVNVAAPVVSGEPTVGETLSTTNGLWTGYPLPTFTYQWRADSVDIVGETNNTLLLTSGELGAFIDCVVTATNSEGTASQASNSVGPVVAAGNALLLETGDALLLESGDRLLLEA